MAVCDHSTQYCILRAIGGEFFTHLRKNKRFESDDAKFYASMIVDIFDYLHADNIIYR